jgi:hypoxanthine phosphoribosyltransferase
MMNEMNMNEINMNETNGPRAQPLRQVIAAEQIQKRVKELARHISNDYRGQTIQALAVLENAFIFMADLVRALEVPVVCQFIKPKYSKQHGSQSPEITEIFFSHEPDIRGQHILLVEGLVHSGVTSEFLMNDLRARGAASVKIASPPAVWPCSRTTSASSWMTPFSSAMALAQWSKPTAISPACLQAHFLK